MTLKKTRSDWLVLGIETSCDETGIGLYDTRAGLLAHALHSQVAMHADYGGVVPELASRDHIVRALPLIETVLAEAGKTLNDINGIAYTEGPGLAGALLVGAALAQGLALARDLPVIGVHHLEGHMLAPLLSANPPTFPFVALLVSGGHTQLMRVDGLGQYQLLGETLDDAAGEAFDKTAKLLGLPYPGGPQVSALAARATQFSNEAAVTLPRPMLRSGDLDFSFSGLKTAVLTVVKQQPLTDARRAIIAQAFEAAMVEVLTTKALRALDQEGLDRLVVAGGVGANRPLRAALDAAAAARGAVVHYPELAFCTDNGAMIALAGALRLNALSSAALDGLLPEELSPARVFNVRPRWALAELR